MKRTTAWRRAQRLTGPSTLGQLRLAVLVVTLLTAALLTAADAAGGPPSVWARARDKTLHRSANALAKTEAIFAAYQSLRDRGDSSGRAFVYLQKAHRLLQAAKAGRSANPKLRYYLAQVLRALHTNDGGEHRLRKAVRLLRWVTAQPEIPTLLRADALYDIAVSYARLGDPKKEVVAYRQALAIEVRPLRRPILLANLAEAWMIRGEISAAVRGYKAALQQTPTLALAAIGVTTYWGLAVALDRSGNLEGGMQRIELARTYDPGDTQLKGPNWFFIPAYDKYWYAALGWWTKARAAKTPAQRAAHLSKSVAGWLAYIDSAPLSDIWLALAQHHLHGCENELKEAQSQKPGN